MKTTALVCLLAVGCNVPLPKGSRGTHLGDAAGGDGGEPGACSRAVVVTESDYMSTNVALLRLDGTVLAPSVASSATGAVGLVAPLSGDVVTPTMPVRGAELVLVDSAQSSSRIVWVDPETAARRELSVATGFWSDPRDYVEVAPGKAYVPRYNPNPAPGKVPFDAGNDVLVLDVARGAVVRSIDVSDALGPDGAKALPDADKIVLAGERAYVLLGALPRDFSGAQVSSRLVAIDTTRDEVTSVTVLDGLLDCAGLVLSPDAKKLAALCSGKRIDPSARSDLDGSGVALVDITGEPRIVKRIAASDIGDGPIGFFGAFSSASSLVVQTFGFDDPSTGDRRDDALVRLDLDGGPPSIVLESAGEPFTLGGVACDVHCGACFVADAKRDGGVVHRFSIDDAGALSADRIIKVETDPGLPPRYIGLF
jgi:hypothetical protein